MVELLWINLDSLLRSLIRNWQGGGLNPSQWEVG
ncbi:hypothetical protein LINPERHAP1_LOCUS8822 [Linum perenne]